MLVGNGRVQWLTCVGGTRASSYSCLQRVASRSPVDTDERRWWSSGEDLYGRYHVAVGTAQRFLVDARILWLSGHVTSYELSANTGGRARFVSCASLLGLFRCEARGGVVLASLYCIAL